jgi:hypothetical protein
VTDTPSGVLTKLTTTYVRLIVTRRESQISRILGPQVLR